MTNNQTTFIENSYKHSLFIFHFSYDCTNVEHLTKAEMEGREQAMHALQALKGVVPGFEKARLRNFGMTIGTRDSRKIVGRYVNSHKINSKI